MYLFLNPSFLNPETDERGNKRLEESLEKQREQASAGTWERDERRSKEFKKGRELPLQG